MKHFVAYHSENTMGYELEPSDEKMGFLSNKKRGNLDNAIGEKLWMISGKKGSNRKNEYHLVGFYIPSVVKKPDQVGSGFEWLIWGDEVHLIEPVRLNDFDWFPALVRSQGCFAFGITEIRDPEIVKELEKLAKVKSNRSKAKPKESP